MCSLPALRLRALNLGVGWALLSLKALGEGPSPPLPASGGSSCSLGGGHLTATSAYHVASSLYLVFAWPPYKDARHWI